jgi:hypothetical protein
MFRKSFHEKNTKRKSLKGRHTQEVKKFLQTSNADGMVFSRVLYRASTSYLASSHLDTSIKGLQPSLFLLNIGTGSSTIDVKVITRLSI